MMNTARGRRGWRGTVRTLHQETRKQPIICHTSSKAGFRWPIASYCFKWQTQQGCLFGASGGLLSETWAIGNDMTVCRFPATSHRE